MDAIEEDISCYCVQFRRAASAVSNFYADVLAPAGITQSQYTILRCINSQEPCTVSALAQHIGLERTTLVRTIKPLKERGLIEDVSLKGARNCQLRLTDEGRRTLQVASPLWERAQKTVEDRIGLEKLQLIQGVSSVFENEAPKKLVNN